MACNYAKGKSTYVPCIAWDKLARKINSNFKVGDTIAIEGKFQSRSYTDREGVMRITHELSINKVITPMG